MKGCIRDTGNHVPSSGDRSVRTPPSRLLLLLSLLQRMMISSCCGSTSCNGRPLSRLLLWHASLTRLGGDCKDCTHEGHVMASGDGSREEKEKRSGEREEDEDETEARAERGSVLTGDPLIHSLTLTAFHSPAAAAAAAAAAAVAATAAATAAAPDAPDGARESEREKQS